jgi:hypothetical protein
MSLNRKRPNGSSLIVGSSTHLGCFRRFRRCPAKNWKQCSGTRFHRPVFVLPPWEAIYTNDAERDQTYAEAVVVYEKLLRW